MAAWIALQPIHAAIFSFQLVPFPIHLCLPPTQSWKLRLLFKKFFSRILTKAFDWRYSLRRYPNWLLTPTRGCFPQRRATVRQYPRVLLRSFSSILLQAIQTFSHPVGESLASLGLPFDCNPTQLTTTPLEAETNEDRSENVPQP